MTQIEKQIIEEVLAPYKPDARYLLSADFEYPDLSGKFVIGPTFYHSPPLEHAADIEIQLCLNQLIYTGMAKVILEGGMDELKGFDFQQLRKENMLIIESKKRFRRPIKTGVEIFGEVSIQDWHEYEGLLLGNAKFQFENRSCFGNLELALVSRNNDTGVRK